jgi:DNA polymerase V
MMSASLLALIDCDNFFVSCERLFRADLQARPVVVLSSNDGCVVSRSKEAKALGIPMGAPAFQYQQLFKIQGVVQFSANFELYGDISERIIRLLTAITPRIEVYSVDEAFLGLDELDINDWQAWAVAVRARVAKEVGIPVSIGIAETKTLAKIAVEHAKHVSGLEGVLYLSGQLDRRRHYLAATAIQDVWGIGRRLAPRLRAEGVYTALDLARLRPRYAQQLMGVHGRRLVAELSGQCCHQLEQEGTVRQSIMHGRIFGEDTQQFLVIEAAIASLTNKAASRLRAERLLAQTAVVQLTTNRHKPGYQRLNRQLNFQVPTADGGYITAQLVAAVKASFSPSNWYHRVNIMLYDLVSQDGLQFDLFGNTNLEAAQSAFKRLWAVDSINKRYGRQTVHYAAEDLSNSWQPKRLLRSPRYTTNWQELPVVHTLQPKLERLDNKF